jgi:acylphosphatase
MSDKAVDKAVDVVVTGRVQGVFFRASCAAHAEQLHVRGWVENRTDGSVAGHFEGDHAAVDALVAWCRGGPPRALVSGVSVDEGAAEGSRRFEVR